MERRVCRFCIPSDQGSQGNFLKVSQVKEKEGVQILHTLESGFQREVSTEALWRSAKREKGGYANFA